jgi:hypothetical protein
MTARQLKSIREALPQLLTSIFALCWIGARARIQSITIDEADSYRLFVATAGRSYWIPAANNHVLNSMLMRCSTSLLGVSNLTLRLPAFLGAIVYVASVYVLVEIIAPRLVLRWALLACLLFNPFVMDYLVAARGYSLALGFLTAALAIAAWRQARKLDPLLTCALCSGAMAFSFAANFSFAIADGAILAAIALWCAAAYKRPAEIVAATVFPGLIIAAVLTGTVLVHWPGNEFRWGADTFSWSMKSIGEQLFYRVDPRVLGTSLSEFLVRYRHFFYPLLLVTVLWRIASVRRAVLTPWQARFALLIGTALAGTLLLHGVLVWRVHLLWPRGRTGLFVPVLCLLLAGSLAAIPRTGKTGRDSARALTALLVAMACYFILCLRLTWFAEWYWNANSDRLYDVVAHYNQAYGVKKIGANWRYVSVLNYYRTLSGKDTIDEVLLERPIPEGRQLYVLFPEDDDRFLKRDGLKVVYHDPLSDAEVAVR